MSDRTKVLYTEEEIKKRLSELAQDIATEYKNKNPLFVCILKSSFIFLADLIRAVYKEGLTDFDVAFIAVSSYGTSTTYSGKTAIVHDIVDPLEGKDIILVDDIIDTGYTIDFVRNHLLKKKPLSLKVTVLLDKKELREVDVPLDFVGFTLAGKPWVEGYGLDGGKFGRGRPELAEKVL